MHVQGVTCRENSRKISKAFGQFFGHLSRKLTQNCDSNPNAWH